MYVCPDCKTPLENLFCATCQLQFPEANGIPLLLSANRRLQSASDVGAAYDDIYAHRTAVWEDQGRTAEFINYLSGLAADISTGSILEIGCGEGFLLRELRATEKSAIDISLTALSRATARARANIAVAFAEYLPFADGRFDLVISVGVMEHFLDDVLATREIARVLKPNGHYIALIHTDLSVFQRIKQKIREFVFPVPRPTALARWILSKAYRPVHQPIQRRYTQASGRDCLERGDLSVERVISLATDPWAPLVGPHVMIYVARLNGGLP